MFSLIVTFTAVSKVKTKLLTFAFEANMDKKSLKCLKSSPIPKQLGKLYVPTKIMWLKAPEQLLNGPCGEIVFSTELLNVWFRMFVWCSAQQRNKVH